MKLPPLHHRLLGLALALGAGSALALPTGVSVTPPDGARFLAHQRFDLRVEGKGVPGATGYSATLEVDGKPLQFSSGAQHTATTDGISSPGWGGFNLRGYSFAHEGVHTITATFSDSTGTVTVSSKVLVINPFKGRESGA